MKKLLAQTLFASQENPRKEIFDLRKMEKVKRVGGN